MALRHEDLVAWQRADDLCLLVYELTKGFPPDERFGLTGQLRRAAFSVGANIVEGFSLPRSPARVRFIRTAVASLAEVGYGLHVARRVGYLSEERWSELDAVVRGAAAPLHGLLKQQSSGVNPG